MKYLIPFLIIVITACNQEKQQLKADNNSETQKQEKVNQKPQEFKKKDAIAHIREMFASINEQSKSAKIIEKDMMDESAEGGQVKAYKQNGEIIKLEMLAFGETGRASKEYYFENDKLIFAFTKEDYYDRPIYIEGAKISKIEENRYYFFDEELFLWLDPEKKEVNLANAEQTSANIIEEVKHYISVISK